MTRSFGPLERLDGIPTPERGNENCRRERPAP